LKFGAGIGGLRRRSYGREGTQQGAAHAERGYAAPKKNGFNPHC
jgi:hypothetical protein